jgi:HTH-type transcriptional regulator/antitoxin HigA
MTAATYEELLAEVTPARIGNEVEYDSIRARFGDLLGRKKRTRAQDKLMDLLGVLIMDYDSRNAMPPDDSTPAEILQFLVEHSGKIAAELLRPVFGQRSHVNEALNGKRPISADQARKLGKLFSVSPGLFVK